MGKKHWFLDEEGSTPRVEITTHHEAPTGVAYVADAERDYSQARLFPFPLRSCLLVSPLPPFLAPGTQLTTGGVFERVHIVDNLTKHFSKTKTQGFLGEGEGDR